MCSSDLANHGKKTLSDELDAVANTFYLADGDEAVAALRSVPAAKAPSSRQIQFYEVDKMPEVPREAITFTSRLILAPEWRGTRALGMLLGAVYEDSRRTGTWLDLVNVTPSLVALYEVMGYRRFLPSVMDPEAGLCFPMAMVADEIGRAHV